jgi:cytochrome c553
MLSKKLIVAMMFSLVMAAGGAFAGGDAANGAKLSADCADCHGDDGLGDEHIPRIAGQDAAELAGKLTDFQSGAVESEMVDFIEGYSEQDLLDLAAYYATLPAD